MPDMHYHLTNLWKRITTKLFDYFGIIALKQQKFAQSDPILIRLFSKKLVVRSSADPAKIGFSPDPHRSSPDSCSSLLLVLARDQRWALDWTWIGWIRTMPIFVEAGLDPDCKFLHKFRIRTGFGLSKWKRIAWYLLLKSWNLLIFWTWTFNFKKSLDCGWTWTEF